MNLGMHVDLSSSTGANIYADCILALAPGYRPWLPKGFHNFPAPPGAISTAYVSCIYGSPGVMGGESDLGITDGRRCKLIVRLKGALLIANIKSAYIKQRLVACHSGSEYICLCQINPVIKFHYNGYYGYFHVKAAITVCCTQNRRISSQGFLWCCDLSKAVLMHTSHVITLCCRAPRHGSR